ncbi:MAG: GNAT family N-acetyltransferase [Chloroflexota bacterium]
MEPRPYRNLVDFRKMQALLAEGRQAANGTYYVHPGDLAWWLFYNDDATQPWQSRLRLWMDGRRLVGWSLLSPFYWHAFDVYVKPTLRGSDREREMLAWAVDQLSADEYIQTVWVAEDDEFRVRWLEENGFAVREGFMHLLTRPLVEPFAGPPLPDGFAARASRGPEDAERRAAASHAAFGSSMPFDEYCARTLRFMKSPVYVNEHELFITAPDEQVAAFCCIWTDHLSKAGYFEPVGVHPAFHRRGLGKGLLHEGLRRLQSESMTSASVCAESDNLAAIRLYESAGFQKTKRLLTFRKAKPS